MCGPQAPWTSAQGGLSHAMPLGGWYVTGHDPSPAHAGGRVTPDMGFPPQGRAHGRPPRPEPCTWSAWHPTPTHACGGGSRFHTPEREPTVPGRISLVCHLWLSHLWPAKNPSLVLPLAHHGCRLTEPPAQLLSLLQGGTLSRTAAAAHQACHAYRRVVASRRRVTHTAGPSVAANEQV